jgi:hypothetical protein
MSDNADTSDGAQPEVLVGGRTGHSARPPTRRSRRRVSAELVVIALVAGLAIGYVVGHHHRKVTPRAAPLPAASPVPSKFADSAVATGNTCADQIGQQLQLGVEIRNLSSSTLTLSRVAVALPLGGLHATAQSVGTCGQVTQPTPVDDTSVPAGSTAWLTTTFDVLVRCPGANPVEFTLHYRQGSRTGTTPLDEFPDLGQVRYGHQGCKPLPQQSPVR